MKVGWDVCVRCDAIRAEGCRGWSPRMPPWPTSPTHSQARKLGHDGHLDVPAMLARSPSHLRAAPRSDPHVRYRRLLLHVQSRLARRSQHPRHREQLHLSPDATGRGGRAVLVCHPRGHFSGASAKIVPRFASCPCVRPNRSPLRLLRMRPPESFPATPLAHASARIVPRLATFPAPSASPGR